ncbi:hypothetical protein Tco_1419156 [Tanacetum coccineum]
MVEPEKRMKKKELIRLDEEIASKLQAKFDEEVKLTREKAEKEQEANVALTEEWDDIQAKIEADHELAQRLQAQEQEELSDAEKATLFVQLLEKRRKHFAAKRAEEKRNKPPTQAQQRKIMCTYLKNMEGKKPKDLKNKSFDSIQKMFDRAFKRVNTFVDFRTDLVEGSSKRAGEELEQESSKKQKVDDDKETAELKSLMEVIPDEEEVALDAIPLAVKSPSIVDWKIHKEGKKSYYQIIRADGSSKMYLVFSHMLKSFDREDLETLYKLVKAKYGSTRPVEDLDLVLYGDLKTMFEPHVEDNVWKNQSDYRVLDWKLYDSCGVHSLRKQNVQIHMLVEKRYPLTAPTITDMLNRLLDDLGVTAAQACLTAAKLNSTPNVVFCCVSYFGGVTDKDAAKGIKHWGERRKLCVKKLHGYGHLEEVVLKELIDSYTSLKKLFHLNDSDIFDFIVALRMFTRSLVIKCRSEDLRLGVESYQKKLNITAPQQTFPEIEFKELYTPSYKPPGIRERQIIRNLEQLVGARELEMDYKMMMRTVLSSGPISKSYLVNNVNM